MAKKSGVLAVLIIIFAIPATGLFADAKSDYDSLFGAMEKKISATGDKKDDVEFAQQLIESAGELGERVDLQTLMLEKACDFALKDPSGYASATKAVSRLKTIAPKRAGEWDEKLIQIYQQIYSRSKGESRKVAGEKLIAQMITAGDSYLASGDGKKARTNYQRAFVIANTIRSGRTESIRTKIKNIAVIEAAARKLKAMEDKLKADPKDMTARMGLINHRLLDLDSPIEAQKLVTKDVDEFYQVALPLAAKSIKKISQ